MFPFLLYNHSMPFEPDFIRAEIDNQSYQISMHADDERLADGLTIAELEMALLDYEIIESYPEDPRGESCLILGFVDEKPVHVVCGRNRAGHLVLITVYIPTMPKWKDPYTRKR
ncbi:MAG: DUF4258 domain-containing protein [Anaerolineales bacterium]|nr:DUF4258 domain-containing protein [Anaerolineales bacterium]